jgi:hypothetical protein
MSADVGAHLKTTIDMADNSLVAQAREPAAARNTPMRALVAAGLRRVLEEQQPKGKPFKLRHASFKGRGSVRTSVCEAVC